ncbi:SRPBCC family protein [Vibrio parahaemolyticus]
MDKVTHCVASVQCKACRAFKFFTDASQLESWLTAQADVVPKVGGKFELFWTPEERENNSTLGCKITAMRENQLLAFEWRSPAQYKHFANFADPLTHVVISFIPNGLNTVIHLVHSGWRSTPEWDEARQWQERAWNVALNSLQVLASNDKT